MRHTFQNSEFIKRQHVLSHWTIRIPNYLLKTLRERISKFPHEEYYQHSHVLLYFPCYFKASYNWTVDICIYPNHSLELAYVYVCLLGAGVGLWRTWESVQWGPLTSGLIRRWANLHLTEGPWQPPIQTDWLWYIMNPTTHTRTIERVCAWQLQTWDKHESQPIAESALATEYGNDQGLSKIKPALESTGLQATGPLMQGHSQQTLHPGFWGFCCVYFFFFFNGQMAYLRSEKI